jgi:hypothetical protein
MNRDLSYKNGIRMWLGQVCHKPGIKFLNVEMEYFEGDSTFLVFVGRITRKKALYGIHYVIDEDQYYFGSLWSSLRDLHKMNENELKIIPLGILRGCKEIAKSRVDRIIENHEWGGLNTLLAT